MAALPIGLQCHIFVYQVAQVAGPSNLEVQGLEIYLGEAARAVDL
jgi:hypothetical protein